MDGVFMSKVIKFVWSASLVLCLFLAGVVLADKYQLRQNIIRLRVVAASDSYGDQQRKLEVRDAVNSYLKSNMPDVPDAKAAKQYLATHLPVLQEVAAATLCSAGCDAPVRVYLTTEETDSRSYDTFRLPSGVYDTLRIDIGEAQGENWWCVVFPGLCMPATTEGFSSVAASAGFDSGLTDTLAETEGFEIRFFLLDCVGKLEKMLYWK